MPEKTVEPDTAVLDWTKQVFAVLGWTLTGDTGPEPGSVEADLFAARLKALKPAIDGLIATGTALGGKARGELEAAVKAAKAEDHAAGGQALDRIEALLRQGYESGALPPPDAGEFRRVWAGARSAWQQASELVDGQISGLQAVLRSSGDSELKEIADFGLNAITGNHKVRVMAAIRDIDGSKDIPPAPALGKAEKAITAFAAHIASDPRVAACDRNPFKVPMTVRSSIGAALVGLQRALSVAQVAK